MLADASKHCSDEEKVVRLVDEDIEDSEIINLFLTLAVDGTLDVEFQLGYEDDTEACKTVIRLVRFMDKWECSRLWRSLYYNCADGVWWQHIDYQIAFIIGCAINNMELCRMSLDKLCESHDTHSDTHECQAEPGGFSLERWNLIDHEYAWLYIVACKRAKMASFSSIGLIFVEEDTSMGISARKALKGQSSYAP